MTRACIRCCVNSDVLVFPNGFYSRNIIIFENNCNVISSQFSKSVANLSNAKYKFHMDALMPSPAVTTLSIGETGAS